jgi:GAF domain-containing protein
MTFKDKIDIDTFKIVTQSIAESKDLESMGDHLSRLLVAALGIKGCILYLRSRDTNELQVLAGFGPSLQYLTKGPVLADRSIARSLEGEPVIIRDTAKEPEELQYPQQAKKEGIGAILSIPVMFSGEVVGILRLYHGERWDVSENDVNTLLILAEIIGLALRYTSLLKAATAFSRVLKDLPVDLD